MGLVSKDEYGGFMIGPLTEEQYRVILDSLELASTWVDRDLNNQIAQALHKLISRPVPVDTPIILELPHPESKEIERE